MSVRGCILSLVFSVLACLGASSVVAAQSSPDEHLLVLIGNELYSDLNHNVDVTPNNLFAVETYFDEVEGISPDNIVSFTDKNAIDLEFLFNLTSGDIAKQLRSRAEVRRMTVYYSGHGTQDPTFPGEDKGILLGTDAKLGREFAYGVSTEVIIDNLATLAVETDVEITLILEACFNGQTGSGEPINAEISGSLSDELGRKQAAGVTVISASSKTQPAYWQTAEESEEPLSRFTDAFLDTLYGYGGGLDDGTLTITEALSLTNDILARARVRQVASVSGFNPEAFVLREGEKEERWRTELVCDDEFYELELVKASCRVEEINQALTDRKCRQENDEYGALLSQLVSRTKDLDRALRRSGQLDKDWQRSTPSLTKAKRYFERCDKLTADLACPTFCEYSDVGGLDGLEALERAGDDLVALKAVERAYGEVDWLIAPITERIAAAELVRARRQDEVLWQGLDASSGPAMERYLSECSLIGSCAFDSEARAVITRLKEEARVRDELRRLWAGLDQKDEAALVSYLDRCSGSDLCESEAEAQTALAAVREEKRQIAEDEAAWSTAQPLSEATALAYLEDCEQRSVCQYREIAAPFSLEYQTTRDTEAWAATDQEDIASLAAYLESCSDRQICASKNAAEQRIAIINSIAADQAAWEATDQKDIASLQAYLEGCGERIHCEYKKKARGTQNQLQLELSRDSAAWNATDKSSSAALELYLKTCNYRTFCNYSSDAEKLIDRLNSWLISVSGGFDGNKWFLADVRVNSGSMELRYFLDYKLYGQRQLNRKNLGGIQFRSPHFGMDPIDPDGSWTFKSDTSFRDFRNQLGKLDKRTKDRIDFVCNLMAEKSKVTQIMDRIAQINPAFAGSKLNKEDKIQFVAVFTSIADTCVKAG